MTGISPKQKNNKLLTILAHIAVAIYGIACLWLFYQQSITILPEDKGLVAYQSDLPLHISMIVEDGWNYSFTAYAYKALYLLCNGNTIGIALLLAICATATVYVTKQAICLLYRSQKTVGGQKIQEPCSWFTLLLALTLNLVMPVFLEFVGPYRYISYQSPNIWHNSTYVCMKLFALMTFLYYLKLERKYREGISYKEWVIFALLNIITAGIKPSFLLAFSPIMGIFLLVDLFRKVSFKRILIFGSALLPSGAVILWQNAVLFGEDTGNAMTFHLWYTFSLHANIPKVAALLSIGFCGVVILTYCKDIKWDKQFVFIILMAMLGFLEALCLVESGARSVDGNFLWGYSFCLFVLFITTAVKAFMGPCGTKKEKAVKIIFLLLYGWHLYCGIEFFIRLVCGESFWMMR